MGRFLETAVGREKALSILREYMHENCDRFGIRSMGVYGSIARGEGSPTSDVDVLIDIHPVHFSTLAQIQYELSDRFGMKVDLIRMRSDMNPLLLRCIEEDAVYA